MNIFSCNRAKYRFLHFKELIYNNLCFAQKPHKNVRIVQNYIKTAFVRTTNFCTKLVRILCVAEGVVFQRVARGCCRVEVRLHKNLRLI